MNRSIRLAILFRIHNWDSNVFSSFNNLLQITAEWRENIDIWLVPDFSKGTFIIPDAILHMTLLHSISEDGAKELGLALFPEGNAFWFNNDYALYLFYNAHSSYDYYCIYEHDVWLGPELDGLISKLAERSIDFLAVPNRLNNQPWINAHYCVDVWAKEIIVANLLCFSIFSNRSIDPLYQFRSEISKRYLRGEIKSWPIAEGFVPTFLQTQGFKIVSLESILDCSRYDCWPPYHSNEIRNRSANSLIHPVLSGQKFVDSVTRYDAALMRSWFDKNSPVRNKLSFEPGSYSWLATLKHFAIRAMHAEALAMIDYVEPQSELDLVRIHSGYNEYISDLVGARSAQDISMYATAMASSYSPWSLTKDQITDATNALVRVPNGSYAFHTNFELGPWWIADLKSIYILSELKIFNRVDFESQRASAINVSLSLNGKEWRRIFSRSSSVPFGGVDGDPLNICISPHQPARYVRIDLDEINALHLDTVRIYGLSI